LLFTDVLLDLLTMSTLPGQQLYTLLILFSVTSRPGNWLLQWQHGGPWATLIIGHINMSLVLKTWLKKTSVTYFEPSDSTGT